MTHHTLASVSCVTVLGSVREWQVGRSPLSRRTLLTALTRDTDDSVRELPLITGTSARRRRCEHRTALRTSVAPSAAASSEFVPSKNGLILDGLGGRHPWL